MSIAPKIPAAVEPLSDLLKKAPRLANQLDRIDALVSQRRAPLLSQDGALNDNPPGPAILPSAGWRDVKNIWRQVIAADFPTRTLEGLPLTYDLGLDLKSLGVDPHDGALLRDGGPGGALAYYPRAFSQLVGLLLTEKTRGTAGVLHHQLYPPARALGFEDVRTDSKRVRPALVRMFRDPSSGIRTVRAVLSERYPSGFFDDTELLPLLDEVLAPDARAAVWRGVYETHGVAHLDLPNEPGINGTLHWRNSETGAARLGFWAGLHITVLDVVVSAPTAQGINVEEVAEAEREREPLLPGTEKYVRIAATGGQRAINHTLPWKDWTPSERREEANRRMRAARDQALVQVKELAAQWHVAMKDFRKGFEPKPGDRTFPAEVLLDSLEEAGRLNGEDREQLLTVLTNEARLAALPFGSAAHVAACFGCLARDAQTLDDQYEFQARGAAWVRDGWMGEGTGVEARRALRERGFSLASEVRP